MTTTLSSQLCEIVGLEYKKVVYSNCFILGRLNFKRPENFVKLLELPLKFKKKKGEIKEYKTVGEYVYYHDSDFWNRESFLNILVYLLTNCDIEDKEAVKESIRRADWIWA